jgi:hypothetical protein
MRETSIDDSVKVDKAESFAEVVNDSKPEITELLNTAKSESYLSSMFFIIFVILSICY